MTMLTLSFSLSFALIHFKTFFITKGNRQETAYKRCSIEYWSYCFRNVWWKNQSKWCLELFFISMIAILSKSIWRTSQNIYKISAIYNVSLSLSLWYIDKLINNACLCVCVWIEDTFLLCWLTMLCSAKGLNWLLLLMLLLSLSSQTHFLFCLCKQDSWMAFSVDGFFH